jgi:RNA polymerase sigma-70 factor (ECF subfamily)
VHLTNKTVNIGTLNETELIKRCQKADPKAQEWIYGQHADSFFRMVMRYVKNREDAEDVLITAFTKIFNRIDSFSYQGDGSLQGWMKKVVINEALMWLRRRHSFALVDSVNELTEEESLETLSTLDAEDIYQMITQLPTGYRTVFNLYVVEGYAHQEIAAMLSITESTSRTQLFKAKALLKKMLTQEGFGYGT